jgi:hypothetical protein
MSSPNLNFYCRLLNNYDVVNRLQNPYGKIGRFIEVFN